MHESDRPPWILGRNIEKVWLEIEIEYKWIGIINKL